MRPLAASAISLVVLGLLGCGVWFYVDRPPSNHHVRVVDVLNGDDIVVRLPGEGDVNIHYIGIDAPEIAHPRFGLEPGGHEAAQANRDIVLRKWVRLELDVEEVDPFGRVLAYVWVHQQDGSEVMANAEMVWRGYARVRTRGPNTKYESYLRDLQTRARDHGLGLWSSESGRRWASQR